MQDVSDRHLKIADSPDVGGSSGHRSNLLRAADIISRKGFPDLLPEFSALLRETLDLALLNYCLHTDGTMHMYPLIPEFRVSAQAHRFSIETSPGGWVWRHQEPLIIPDLHAETRFRDVLDLYSNNGKRSVIFLPLTTARHRLGCLAISSDRVSQFDVETLSFLQRLSSLFAFALENRMALDSSFGQFAPNEEQLATSTVLDLRAEAENESQNLKREYERIQTVIEIQRLFATSHIDLPAMFSAVSKSLQRAIPHDASFVTLWRKKESLFEIYAVEPQEFKLRMQPPRLQVAQTLTAEVIGRAAQGEIIRRKELEEQSQRFSHLRIPLEAGLVTWCVQPMHSPNGLVGVLYLGSRREDAFCQGDLELLRPLACSMAFFIDNAQARSAVEIEKERLKTLLEISRTLSSKLEWKNLFQEISTCVRRLLSRDYAHIALYDPATDVMRFHALEFPEGRALIASERAARVFECPTGITFRARETRVFGQAEIQQIGSDFSQKTLAEGIRTICCVPLVSRGNYLGALAVASVREKAFEEGEIEILEQLAPQIAIALDNSRAYAEISHLKDKLAKEKVYLEQEIRDVLSFEEIVGQSEPLTRVLDQVRIVAPSTATVLILGETGTGKEMVGRAIHRLSSRASANFVKLNCAAIPTGLLESELFGHEKGAFTGAVSQKIGRLELADKGTLFLDEIGEIPAELQPKLLRVLQDQEFERLGGTRTIRVNVRLLAATNRDLARAVSNHEFRADLYYRLHVFPIRVPSLRERAQDIPLLVHYFVQKFARRMNKKIEIIPAEAMRALEQWHWPGNIRELENFIERSVILTEGASLHVPIGELSSLSDLPEEHHEVEQAASPSHATLEELEREYILKVLREVHGVIAGSDGAAARLGMKRTTLQSKIHRLNIRREEYGA
jgi:formate hydrogenlyase transcriptional activator